jgi:hypothetical protein
VNQIKSIGFKRFVLFYLLVNSCSCFFVAYVNVEFVFGKIQSKQWKYTTKIHERSEYLFLMFNQLCLIVCVCCFDIIVQYFVYLFSIVNYNCIYNIIFNTNQLIEADQIRIHNIFFFFVRTLILERSLLMLYKWYYELKYRTILSNTHYWTCAND